MKVMFNTPGISGDGAEESDPGQAFQRQTATGAAQQRFHITDSDVSRDTRLIYRYCQLLYFTLLKQAAIAFENDQVLQRPEGAAEKQGAIQAVKAKLNQARMSARRDYMGQLLRDFLHQ
ncbi:epithelial chloride channel -like protein [Labeo rohita]|uniref:Epithelial chloride channel-like protein n=1 Tax=Labeo rohita TaxID=84645 RepID=A0A498MTL1_LABRO|nr:epithelial chloride channel -like protein [Labeo rohita]